MVKSWMAFPRGCSLPLSAEPMSRKNSSSSTVSAKRRKSVTEGRPLVRVPVLSKRTADTLCASSRATPPLIRMPFLAPTPVPTITAVGVARARLHGQAITITGIPNRHAKKKALDPPGTQSEGTTPASVRINHNAKVRPERQRMTGTKIREIMSAMAWMGAFSFCASSTRFTMQARAVSAPTRVAFMWIVPCLLMVPPITSWPTDLATGTASPVSIDWSIDVAPNTISPSVGICSPGTIFRTSPFCTRFTSISFSSRTSPVRSSSMSNTAVSACSARSFVIASAVFPLATKDKRRPNMMNVISSTDESK